MKKDYQWYEDDLRDFDLEDVEVAERAWDYQDLMSAVMVKMGEDEEEEEFMLGVKLGMRMVGALLLPTRSWRSTCDVLWRSSWTESRVSERWYDLLEPYRGGNKPFKMKE